MMRTLYGFGPLSLPQTVIDFMVEDRCAYCWVLDYGEAQLGRQLSLYILTVLNTSNSASWYGSQALIISKMSNCTTSRY